ncbi:RNI-like protein [Neocallimastix sp. 'constans']
MEIWKNYAFDNNFTGQLVIPENSNLIELDVNWNELTGNLIIPENSNLKYLNKYIKKYASGNKLTGNLIIPENSNLERLIIRNNQLIGELIIPENYNLKELCISNNQLSGKLSIPENSNLIELDVSNNQLTGNLIIPENSNLRDLYVINNNLTGKLLIPKNSKLRLLDVRNNQLEGKLIIPENPYFEILDASDNQLTGDLIIPKSSNLSELYVNDNQLTGRLIISENSNLKNLYISNNQLKGKLTIPKNIKVINAHGNKFDSIYAPFKFDNHLINLDISSNQFNNNIFETLSKFNQLLYLDISNNNMNGTLIIPKTIETVDISSNQFNDDVFETLLKFDKIQDLNLSGNNLKKLPSNFFKLQTLRVLALENIPHLNVKLINFENSPIENCFLRGTSISCYQKGTCLQIDTDEDIDYYDECSNKVINNMLYSNSEDKKNYEEVDKVDKSSLSNDCLQINKFLNKNERSNCCHITGIECDENNRIIELNLNNENNSFPGTLDFNKFPILQNLKFLKFNYFEMNSLSSKFFELPSLESLDLYDNLIKEFPYQFSSLKKLRYLSLGKNKINEELTDDILKFNLLEYLKINDNNLIGKLIVPPLLQVISAQNNNLNSIGLNNNSLLEKLYLDNNSFEETIFNDLIKFENLYWLYLMKNKKIKNIPPLIYKLKNIEIIDLKETGIEELPSNFFKFSNIKRLYLSSDSQKFKIIKFVNSPIDYCYFYNTPIFCVEPETCNNVKTDKYNSCSVDTINDIKNSQTITKENEKEFNGKNSNEIFYSKDCEFLKEFLSLPLNTNCCSLENMIECDKNNNILKLKLEITSANINTLPSVLFSLTNLQTLNINKSKITEITNDIDPRCVLETINLSDNNLKKFPYQFNIISSLKYLNLTNNSITEEFQNKILSFPSIENIYLDNNHISGELFIPESVKILTLQGNSFNGDIFNNLTQFKELNYLDLSYNKKIRSIPQSIEKLNKLRTFSLESSSSIFKIIKFENEKTECTFYDTPILCYQTDSCINVDNNLYRNCTPEEINEVKSKLSIQTSEKKEISKDCEQFSTFVSKPLNLDCCEEFGISCDENDSIKKLYINNEQNSIIEYYIDNSESIDFENFPNLSNIEKIEIANIELKKIPTVFFQLPLKIL